MNTEDSTRQKQIVLRLRWVTIIITSYLVLFGRSHTLPELPSSLLVCFYLASNVALSFFPAPHFSKLTFFSLVLLFDTLMISLGIYITSQFDTDFYLVYFIIILFAAIARSFKLLMINAIVICVLYGWLLWTKGWDMKLEEGILLRIPFIFIVNLFYGFLIQSYEEKTKRIKMELEEVEASELKYRQIVEGAHDAVAVLDESNHIKFFNGRLLSLTQYTPEELTGMAWEKIMTRWGEEEVKDGFTAGSGSTSPLTREADVLRKDGEKRKVEVGASQFVLSNGGIHTILYLKDITDRKQMEERLIQSEKLRAIGEMAAGIAHDFNNVLGAILGRAQLIKLKAVHQKATSKGSLDETALKELEIIEQAALDGAHTVRKIQDFTRSETDESFFLPLDVNEIMEGAIELAKTKIKDEAQAKGIQIDVQVVKNELRPVMGSPTELREVLLNIILNSLDAMPKGGKIVLKTEMEDGFVSIEARDNGKGMSESVRQRVFDPFFTTNGIRRSGLGLSVSYGIIQRHHGEIRVESQEGLGTAFTIKLPVAASEEM
jgi:PAS domain S-box-containing protein